MLSQGRKFGLEQLYSYMISDQQLIVYQIMWCNAFFSRKFKKVVYNLYPQSKINQRRFNYIFQELLYNEIWHSIYLNKDAMCMYSTVAVSASCNIGTYKGMFILRTYTHIYRGFCTVFVTDICTGMSMHTFVDMLPHIVQCDTGMYRCQVVTAWRCRPWFGFLWSSSEQSGSSQSF